MSEPSRSPVGLSGYLCMPTRGAAGPGEVVLRIRGGTEIFAARSTDPLPDGCEVVVVGSAGPRTVIVEALESSSDGTSDDLLEL